MCWLNVSIQPGDSLLIEAVKVRDYDRVQDLLKHGAKVDLPTIEGTTSIMIVAVMGDIKLAEILLSYEPNLLNTNDNGDSAISIIIERGDEAMIALFKEKIDWSMVPPELQTKHEQLKITAMYERWFEGLHSKEAAAGDLVVEDLELNGENADNG